jgi:hypothetical protein
MNIKQNHSKEKVKRRAARRAKNKKPLDRDPRGAGRLLPLPGMMDRKIFQLPTVVKSPFLL